MQSKKHFNNIMLSFAIVFAILAIANVLITHAIDPKSKTGIFLGLVLLVTFVFIPIWATKLYKKNEPVITLKNAIKLGVLIGLIGGFIAGIYAMVYYKFINPEGIEQKLEMSREVLVKLKPDITPDKLEEQMKVSRKIFIPSQFGGQVFFGLLFGVIGGVIGGLLYKTPTDDY